jgi:pimeloyl-ACP methyl ester carboxylesterase
LGGALGRLMAVAEAYPDLKANQNMMQLSEKLTSTENKVAFARQAYNDAVMSYNNHREVFPASMVAGMFNFQPAQPLDVAKPEVREAIRQASDPSLPQEERLRALQMAFFAPDHDPHVWLSGWHPATEKMENEASAATPVDLWFAGGKAPILDLQAENDAVAQPKFRGVLKSELGGRVTVVVIPNAGHALVPEQPEAMANAISVFARSLQ